MLDAIFGAKNFRNEIVWVSIEQKARSQHKPSCFGQNLNSIFFYSLSNNYYINPYRIHTEEEVKRVFNKIDKNGQRYAIAPLWSAPSMGARPNLCYKWKGFVNPHPSGWRLSRKRMNEEYAKGNIVIRHDGKLERRRYLRDVKGRVLSVHWNDIAQPAKKERIGYPTQKPLALLNRIIKASSKQRHELNLPTL